MARKSRTSLFEDLATFAARLPAWLSFTLAVVVYLVLDHFNAQPVTMEPQPGSVLPSNFAAAFYRPVLIALQYIVPLAFALGGAVSMIKSLSGLSLRKQYLSTPDTPIVAPEAPQSEVRPTSTMSWDQFELLVGEAFRQQGYRVLHGGDAGPDGGVDVHLKKDGHQYLVQCKHWKTRRVGVAVVRELFGVMVDQGAKGAFIVTSGDFTNEAHQFARDKSIGLINGAKLDKILRKVGQVQPDCEPEATQSPPEAILCPRCNSPMVKRVARQGVNAGREFWGCSRYPKCRGIVKVGEPN